MSGRLCKRFGSQKRRITSVSTTELSWSHTHEYQMLPEGTGSFRKSDGLIASEKRVRRFLRSLQQPSD
jgi:hypothetical protein